MRGRRGDMEIHIAAVFSNFKGVKISVFFTLIWDSYTGTFNPLIHNMGQKRPDGVLIVNIFAINLFHHSEFQEFLN